jgi:hypothetical protein
MDSLDKYFLPNLHEKPGLADPNCKMESFHSKGGEGFVFIVLHPYSYSIGICYILT